MQAYGGAWQLGTDGSHRKLLLNFTIKFKIVVFQNKFCHFIKVLFFFCLFDYQAFSLNPPAQHYERY